MTRQKVMLTAFLATPFLGLAVILVAIKFSRPPMNAPPPVGAGSTSTGGANAIGEYLAHGSAKPHDQGSLVAPESLAQGFVIAVNDVSGHATGPIYLASNLNGWNPADPKYLLAPKEDGRAQIVLALPKGSPTIEFTFTRGSNDSLEQGSDGHAAAHRTLPMVDPAKVAGQAPIFGFVVKRWTDQK